MGQELDCVLTVGRRRAEGRAYLESQVLVFGGADVTLRIPFNAISQLEAKRGVLSLSYPDGRAAFSLGPHAEQWLLKIRYPKGRLDKLGVKPDSVVAVIDVDADEFVPELEARGARFVKGKLQREADLIFLGARTIDDLNRLGALRRSMKPAAAVWVTWPKGRRQPRGEAKALNEDDVRRVAKQHGLVDIKVVSFSDVLSGLKLVIRVADR